MEHNNVIMYSGGLDSFLTYKYLINNKDIKDTLSLLYFNLGARCTSAEIELFNTDSFKKHVTCDSFLISDALNLGDLETESAYIPNRNILAAITVNSITGADRIWIGGTLSDRVNDNNDHVCYQLSNLLSSMHNKDIKIDSPFYDQHKCDIVRNYIETNGFGHYNDKHEAQISLLESTFSCYNPLSTARIVNTFIDREVIQIKTRECLCCPACFRKCMSMYAAGIYIPMGDSNVSKKIIERYYREAKKEIDCDCIMRPRYSATINYVDRFLGTC